MKKIIAIAACCCFHASLLQTSHTTTTHALSVPRLSKIASPLSTRSRVIYSDLENKLSNRRATTIDNQFQYRNDVCLFMAPQTPQPRRPRRMLKKRTVKEGDGRRRKRNRRNRHAENSSGSSSIGRILPGIVSPQKSSNIDDSNEYRPLVAAVRRDAGEDYWIDPKDLERERRRKEEQEKQRAAFLSRKGDEVMPQEKLMTEVKAPYRQNWIGYFSLMVAVLSIIVSQFPELLEPAPTTQFPDL